MNITVRAFQKSDTLPIAAIWNEVVEDGVAFPQEEILGEEAGLQFFTSQSYTGVAVDKGSGEICGMYILHPNNVGRCGHICNASYAVSSKFRGRHVGEALVRDCLDKARALGFKIMQFNAVVASNTPALALYKKLGFTQLGVIPGGFRLKDGTYADIIPHYLVLNP